MFAEADADSDGLLSYGELTAAMKRASKEYSHLEEYARYLERCVIPASLCSSATDCTHHVLTESESSQLEV